MKSKFTKISTCRICGNEKLESLLNLGIQTLTGVFPKSKKEIITSGPLELVKCKEDNNNKNCGLVQLAHTYEKNEMYGENYGYRSGLNKFMVDHLIDKSKKIKKIINLKDNDIVLDIGSNDGTFLKTFNNKLNLVGIDPTGLKFKNHYPNHILLLPNFFYADIFKNEYGPKKAKLVTSFAMFYDLDSPMKFMQEIHEILDDEGVWVAEQSYFPTMLDANSYDTICHEHLEYYCLKQIKWMADKVGFKIIDVEFNNINGGSFSITLAKFNSSLKENTKLILSILEDEKKKKMNTNLPIKAFENRLLKSRENLLHFLNKAKSENKKVIGYGASTKGNVLLQFCNITKKLLPFIGEINKHKFGCFTPNTLIPIISEIEAKKMNPDYFLVLPWHLKENIIKKEKDYLKNGGTLVFPLPKLKFVKYSKN